MNQPSFKAWQLAGVALGRFDVRTISHIRDFRFGLRSILHLLRGRFGLEQTAPLPLSLQAVEIAEFLAYSDLL